MGELAGGKCWRRLLLQMTGVRWHMPGDRWHATHETWHVTCDMYMMDDKRFFLFLFFLSISFRFCIGATIKTQCHGEILCLQYEGFVNRMSIDKKYMIYLSLLLQIFKSGKYMLRRGLRIWKKNGTFMKRRKWRERKKWWEEKSDERWVSSEEWGVRSEKWGVRGSVSPLHRPIKDHRYITL